MYPMKVATARVVGGRVQLEAGVFPEGSEVTVISGDDESTFTASADQERALLESIAEVEKGESVTLADLAARLRRFA
jgi:hypothetical protein